MDILFPEPVHVGAPNIGSEERFSALVQGIFARRWLSNAGPLVLEFEHRIAELLGVKHCVTTTNGTVALEIAIRALGLTGEVIVPSYTFVATAHALSWQGLTPVFADIDAVTHNLDPDAVRALITARTSGIIGVHLWGRPAPVTELQHIADDYGLKLCFDAAHAFGVSHQGKRIGSFGDAEVLSFHATKFFNTFEGGAVVTNDDDLADRVRLMRNFGFVDFDEVVYPGTNGKMTEVCAAMGLVNLESLQTFVEHNRRNHAAYQYSLRASDHAELLCYDPETNSNYQYVVIELSDAAAVYRDRLVSELHQQNVRARRYFWPGCHLMEPYRTLNPDAAGALPNTSRVANRVVVLSTGTAVSSEDCRRIGDYVVGRLDAYVGAAE